MVNSFEYLLKKYPEKEYNIFPAKNQKQNLPQHKFYKKNPLCGDDITIYISLDKNILDSVMFECNSCALVRVSASILKDTLQNRSVLEFQYIYQYIYQKLMFNKVESATQENYLNLLKSSREKIQDLLFVNTMPIRIPCVLLPWNALKCIENICNKKN